MLHASFREIFHSAGFWHAEPRSTTSHTRPHAQRGNQCTAGRLAFSVFLTAVSGLKGEAAAFFVFPPLSHLEHWGHPLSSLLLSVLFLHLFLFYIQSGPVCCLFFSDCSTLEFQYGSFDLSTYTCSWIGLKSKPYTAHISNERLVTGTVNVIPLEFFS